MNLTDLGWSHFFQQQIAETEQTLSPARVSRQDINQYHLLSEQGALTGTLPGRFRNQSYSKADLPAVGDWVLVSKADGAKQGQVQIERLLDRKSKFSRKEAGDVNDEQVIAANIDTVLLVNGLDDDFNPNRIERYLLMSWDSGALPVILLNKADLHSDVDDYVEQLKTIAKGVPIHVISAKDELGIDPVKAYLIPGQTCTLLGSSGAGKSTIINALLGYERFETGKVRETDSKGRHTTTFRELVVAPNGGLIIDTPGMRELQFWGESTSLEQSFEDVEALARQCKFRDCGHESEPGCAITAALRDGELEEERLTRYFKLQREIAHLERQEDAAARAKRKQGRKTFAKLIKNRPDKRN